jgi:hypothetical protein
VNAALVAIGGLVLLAGLGWWAYARSQKRSGESESENKALRKGAEVLDAVAKILAEPIAFGGRLRARLLARARKRGLPESPDSPDTSTLPDDDVGSDRPDGLDP